MTAERISKGEIAYLLGNIFARGPWSAAQYLRMRRQQFYAGSELRRMQAKKLRALLHYAHVHCPYYKNLFRAHAFDPLSASLGHLKMLPPLTKADVNDCADEIKSDEFERFRPVANQSGGSTGTLTHFYQSPRRNLLNGIAKTLFFTWTGWQPGQPIAQLWGQDLERAILQRLRSTVYARIRRISTLNSFSMDQETMESFVNQMTRVHPRLILSYVSSATELADYISSAGFDMRKFTKHLRGVITSAERLDTLHREYIETIFQKPVYDQYGSREIGFMAMECERHAGMHINMWNVYLETDQENGHILATDLNNYCFPLIRFDTEDLGQVSERSCPCGRGLSILEKVDGRTSDYFDLLSGKRVHGEIFSHAFYEISGVRQFQIIQRAKGRYSVNVVPSKADTEHMAHAIETLIRKLDCPEVSATVEFVDEIPLTPSGKRHFTINQCRH